jgi:ribosome-associated toxin RatA of RatAB toxin-antitoxin module
MNNSLCQILTPAHSIVRLKNRSFACEAMPKMFTGSEAAVIQRGRQEVYRLAETYPLFATGFRAGEILAQSPDEIVVKVGSSIWGYPTTWIGRGTKTKDESIAFVQTDGLLKGLQALWKFEDVESFTKVTITFHFTLRIPGIGPLLELLIGELKVKPTVKMILRSLKKASEEET